MIIILSGEIGIGKSSVCRRVVEDATRLGITCGGIVTTKTPAGDITVSDIASGEQRLLAEQRCRPDRPNAGRYYFDPSAVAFGVAAIERGNAAELLLVDELGYLEIHGGGFASVISLISARDKPSLVVIRKALLPAFIPGFFPVSPVVTVTLENRDFITPQVMAQLFPVTDKAG